MFYKFMFVFSSRLTDAQLKQVEDIIEAGENVYAVDVKSHSIDLIDLRGQSELSQVANKVADALKVKRVDNINQDGYLFIMRTGTNLQSAEMKQHGISKAENLF